MRKGPGEKDKQDGRRRRRVMRAFKMNEISLVDRPAQEPALLTIMKRREEDSEKRYPKRRRRGGGAKDVEKRAMLTGTNGGHAHLVVLDPEDGSGARPAGMTMPALTPGMEYEHRHPWVMNEAGDIVIGMAEDHDHEPGELSVGGDMANTLLMEKSAGEAAESGEDRQKEETDMTDETKKAAGDLAAENAQLKKRLARAEKVGALPATHRAHLSKMDETAQDVFLAKSEEDRDQEVREAAKAAQDANPVVYKSVDGTEYRQSDDNRLVALAKRADESLRALEKAQETAETAALRKRAETELANLPGTVETRALLLKQVDAIEDAAQREEALKALRAQNSALSSAFTVVGSSQVAKSDLSGVETQSDAEALLEEQARDLQKTDANLSYADAYVKASENNPDLYAKAVAG